MERVRDESEAVGPHSPEQLHKRKRQVEDKEEEQIASARFREDGSVL